MKHHTEEEYRSAIELVVLGQQGMVSDEYYDHDFVLEEDGDGWNEPYSSSCRCVCDEWEGSGWIQTDPKCSDRPDVVDMVFEWVEHIYRDVFKVYDQEEEIFDGDLS